MIKFEFADEEEEDFINFQKLKIEKDLNKTIQKEDMYSNYKNSIQQQKHKKNGVKGSSSNTHSKSSQGERVVKPKPEWNDAVKDENSYKLSASEIVQKKISMMSKHRLEAKEEWMERQDKLKKGVVDDETKRIYDTARQSKNLSTKDDEIQRKNLSQMLNFIPKPQRDPKSIVQEVKQNLQETRKFIQKVEQYQKDEDPNRLLRVMDRLQQNKEGSNTLNKNIYNQGQVKSARSNSSIISTNRSFTQLGLQQDKNGEQINAQRDDKTENSNEKMENYLGQHDPQMGNYFNSLNKIEETIKFMEEKILCERKSPKKESLNPPKIVQVEKNQIPSSEIRKQNASEMNSTRQNNSSHNSRMTENDAVSFNLSDGEDDSQLPFQKGFQKIPMSRGSLSGEKKPNFKGNQDHEPDLIVNDYSCNLEAIDPNMFFNDHEDAQEVMTNFKDFRPSQHHEDYEYLNENKVTAKRQEYPEFNVHQDYRKEQTQILESGKQTLLNDRVKQNNDNYQQQQDVFQSKQNNYNNKFTSKLQQQVEEEYDQFSYLNNQQGNQKIYKEGVQKNEILNNLKNNYDKQQEEINYEDDDDILSKNIDSIKEMLEATKKDLEKLDCKSSSTKFDEDMLFPSTYNDKQYQVKNYPIQGNKIQEQVHVVSRIGMNSISLDKGGHITKTLNPEITQLPERHLQLTNKNDFTQNSVQEQYLERKNKMPNAFKENNFFESGPASQSIFTSDMFIDNNQMAMNQTSQKSTSQNTNPDCHFTSNMFMNSQPKEIKYPSHNPIQQNVQFAQQEYESDAPRQLNIVKQDLFKKQLQNYSGSNIKPESSLNIKHYLK